MIAPSTAVAFEVWVEEGRRLCATTKRLGWDIGDWWRSGVHRYGDRAKTTARDLFRMEFQTLVNYGVVAERFETNRRRLVLTFKHHAEVASLRPDVADDLLDRAESEGLSTRALRAEVNRLKSAKANEAQPTSCETATVADLASLIASGKTFGTIYADPPWLYDNQGTRAATGNHYLGMTVDALCALPIASLAADDAHLHLWTTNGFLFDAPRLFAAWGFTFRSSFVWVKPQMGIGNYWRNSHEFLLTGIRGKAKRFRDHSLMSWALFERTLHSAKPEPVRAFIERASPAPYLELFGRRHVEGWTVWGDQIERHLFYGNGA